MPDSIQPGKESHELDLVLNEYVLSERQFQKLISGRWSSYYQGSFIRLVVAVAYVSTFLLFFGYLEYLLLSLGGSLPTLQGQILVAIGSILCLINLVLWLTGFRSFPTNIALDESGLRLAWRFRKSQESMVIPWQAVSSVSLERPAKPHGDLLSGCSIILNVRMSFIGCAWLSLIKDTYRLWAYAVPFSLSEKGIDLSRLPLHLPLDALTLEADRYRLLSAIRAHVDERVLTQAFLDMVELRDVPTFTQLWLDDMQSFRRQRLRPLSAGSTLMDGRYEIVGKIASGGQAQIYRARDLYESRTVALKELVLPVNAGAEVRNRSFANVKNEALLLAKLKHQGIVSLLDNFVEDHRAYLVLEHIEGRTLRAVVEEGGALAAEQVMLLAEQMCDLLSYLHGLSPPVVHRDFTPDNLMLDHIGQVRLLDFNVAQQLESDTTKTVVGKHHYMAPEQFRGRPCPQSDLYSLGCTLYYLLTATDPEPLTSSRPSTVTNVPAALDDVIARLTALDLSQRYKSANEAALDLSR